MQPQSTVDRSLKWRLWHSINYNIGAIFFLFGSLLLFPYMSTVLPASSTISAWLYTIGSFCFVLADYTQWGHYEPKAVLKEGAYCFRFPSLSINFFTSFIGSMIYLIGSAVFLPQISAFELGLKLFIAGSSFVFVSQSWKVLRVVNQGIKTNNFKAVLCEDFTGVLVDLFAGLGGIMYFTGSILFFNPDALIQIIAATIFSTGGFFFYLSGAFMIKRYFLDGQKEHQGAIKIASQMKSETQQLKQKGQQLQQTS